MSPALPRVVLIGRINAGKSTLFNTLAETGRALTSPIPGTTRDINTQTVRWRDRAFVLVDTGGLDADQLGKMEKAVAAKAQQTIIEAAVVLLVIDGRHDLTEADRRIAKTLKQRHKNTFLVINKIDSPRLRRHVSPDFFKLGLGEPHYISALRGTGTGDLLDVLVRELPPRQATEPAYEIRVSLIGKTNVGKSSLINAMIGDERIIVSDQPHTTREPQDIALTYHGTKMLFVDTAGLRKKKAKVNQLEKMGIARSHAAVRRSAISIIVTDVSQPLTSQDQAIAAFALEQQNAILVIANKWDLIADKDTDSIARYRKNYRRYFSFIDWAPFIFTSATEKIRIGKILQQAVAVYQEYQRTLTTAQLASLIQQVTPRQAKPSMGKKPGKPTRLVQIDTAPPRFTLYARRPERVHPAYINLLEKKMRSAHGFQGTPISISVTKEKNL